MRKYEFSWDLIGDIEDGRQNLGTQMDVDVYRLMQFTLRDVLEQSYNAEEADRLFFEAGKLAGKEFYKHAIAPVETLEEFVQKAQRVLKEKKLASFVSRA